MRLFRAALLAPALLTMNACIYIDMADFAHYSRDFHFNFPLNPGGHVSVEGFNGSIEITPWDQPTVDISGTKHAPSESQVDALKIDVDHTPDTVSIHAGRQYDSHGSYGVRFAIKVPRGAVLDRIVTSNGSIHAFEGVGPARFKSSNGAVRVEKFRGALDIQTSNGPIELDEVEGAITAHSSNGHIHADAIRGSLDAQTSNNGIKAALLRVDREVRAETRNGSIDLALPAGLASDVRAHTNNSGVTIRLAEPVNARVSARTSNSSISSEFDAVMHGDLRRNDFDGVIGKGGPLLDLSSSNGAIRIVRN
jgi:Putative adhesin